MNAAPWTHPHPYLSGRFAPVFDEISSDPLPIVGELPRDLRGTYVRNSSNPRFAPKGRYHWFDGDGMIHAISIEDGVARYRNRWVRTKAFAAETEAGCALWTGVTERPDFTNPRGPFKDSANTDLVYHAGKLLALWWLGGEPYVVRLPDLATCGTESFGEKIRTVSAHPKVDARTGEMMIFDYKPYPPYLSYGVIGADGTLSHFTTLDMPGPRLQHDMAITENYSLLFDMSLMWDPELLKVGKTRVRFFRDKPSRIGVLPRYGKGEQIRWFTCSPFYMYHTINAWEEGDKIVLVGCRIEYPLADDPENPASQGVVPTLGFLRLAPHLHRWTLDLVTGSVREEVLDDEFTEFPRMDNRLLGRHSRYSYNPRIGRVPEMNFNGIVKYDTDRGTSETYDMPAGSYCGETTFAPRAGESLPSSDQDKNRAREDDGYVLTFAEIGDERSELQIFDARAVDRGPLARVQLPRRVPTGYHTYWISEEELAHQRAPRTPA